MPTPEALPPSAQKFSRRRLLTVASSAAFLAACGGGTETGKGPGSPLTPVERGTLPPGVATAEGFPTYEISTSTPYPSATNPESDKDATGFPTVEETATPIETIDETPEATSLELQLYGEEENIGWIDRENYNDHFIGITQDEAKNILETTPDNLLSPLFPFDPSPFESIQLFGWSAVDAHGNAFYNESYIDLNLNTDAYGNVIRVFAPTTGSISTFEEKKEDEVELIIDNEIIKVPHNQAHIGIRGNNFTYVVIANRNIHSLVDFSSNETIEIGTEIFEMPDTKYGILTPGKNILGEFAWQSPHSLEFRAIDNSIIDNGETLEYRKNPDELLPERGIIIDGPQFIRVDGKIAFVKSDVDPAITPEPIPDETWKTYKGNHAPFTIEYVEEEEWGFNGFIDAFYDYDYNRLNSISGDLFEKSEESGFITEIRIGQFNDATDLQTIKKQVEIGTIKELGEVVGSRLPVHTEEGTVGEYQSYIISTTVPKKEGNKIKYKLVRIVFVPNPGVERGGWMISLQSEPDKFDSYYKQLQQMIQSFKINPTS